MKKNGFPEELDAPEPQEPEDRLFFLAEKLYETDRQIKEVESLLNVACFFSRVRQQEGKRGSGGTLYISIPSERAAALHLKQGSLVNVMIGKGFL